MQNQLTCSVADARQMLGLSHVTVYKLLNEGRLDSIQLGRRRLIKVDSIRRLVDEATA